MKGLYGGFFSILVCFISSVPCFGQANVGDFQTASSGDWNSTANWERWNGTSWVNPAPNVPDFNDGVITIRAFHGIEIPVSYTADVDQLVVQGDGMLTVKSSGRLIIRSTGAADLLIEQADLITTFSDGLVNIEGNGILENRSTISSSSSNLIINGEYQHNRNGGTVPNATWTGSVCRINGITNSAPTGLNQSFNHFIWDCSSQGATMILNGALTSIAGNLIIENSWNGTVSHFVMLGFASANTGSTTVGGNILINNSAKLYISSVGTYTLNVNGSTGITVNSVPLGSNAFPLVATATGTVTINVANNLSFTSAATSVLTFSGTTGLYNTVVNVTGSTSISTATLEMTRGSGNADFNSIGQFSVSNGALNMSSSGSGSGRLNANGNLILNSATVTEGGTGSGNINFVTSAVHTYSRSGGSILNTINFTNAASSKLDLGTSIIEGLGLFTNNGELRVGSPHASGALQNTTISDSDCGNILTPSRSYAIGSVIVYNGTQPQVIGDGHPTTPGVDITIANSNGVSIIAPTTLAGTISLSGGNLNINNSSLTITGNVTGSNRISIGSAGSLTLGGSSNIGTFPFTTGAQTFTNFTLDNPNGVTFANSVTLTGALTLSNGLLVFDDQILTLNGTSVVTDGALSSNFGSQLNIGGTGAFGDLVFSTSGNELNALVYNRATGTLNLASTLILNILDLGNGDFTNSSGLRIADAGRITRRNTNARLLGSPAANDPGHRYNVVYSGGGLTTGLELPSDTEDLNNLTIGGSLTKVLDKNITVNGDLILGSGVFDPGNRTITMRGSNWRNNGGTFKSSDPNGLGTAPYGSTVNFTATTNITGTGTPGFENISVASTGNVTIDAPNVNIAGNMQINASSGFNAGTNTITLTSTDNINQTISAGGKSFHNLTVNKTGGSDVVLSSGLNVTGVITMQSDGSDLNSNGNLTLVSNATATASVAELLPTRTISGNVNVQRYIPAAGRFYRNISSPVFQPPVSNITASGITITGPFTGSSYPCAGCATNNPSLYYYNESVAGSQNQGQVAYPPSGANSATTYLERGRGYNILIRDQLGSPTMGLTGVINSGDINLPVSYTTTSGGANEDGWNFIGNPYPSAIDWDNIAGWSSKLAIQGNQITVWDPNKGTSGGYRAWNGEVGDLGSGVIAAGQGFWIKLNSASSLTVLEAAKTSSSASFLRKKGASPEFLEIVLSGNGNEDRSYIQLKEGASMFYDKFDGPKLMSPEGLNLMLKTDDDVKVGIQAVAELIDETRIPLLVEGLNAGSFTIQINKTERFAETTLLLHDAATNKLHDLSDGFTFAIDEKNIDNSGNRFFLVIGRSSIVTDIEEPFSKTLSIFPNPVTSHFNVQVKSLETPTGEIMDSKGNSLGEVIWKEEDDHMWKGFFDMKDESAGVYFARVRFGAAVKVLKFIKYH